MRHRDHAVVATLVSACNNAGGSAFPRLSARRRMPAHAFGLKKNRGGTVCASSSTRDNEHTTASLGHSEVLSVQHSVGEPIPEFDQRPEEGAKRLSSVLRQDTRDVFPHDPARAKCCRQSDELQREATSSVGQPCSEPGDAEGLTGRPSDEELDASGMNRVSCINAPREVAVVGDVRVVMSEHGRGERFDLREADRRPPERMPSDRRGLNARANG
jgi:hypothetical protein